MVKEVNGQGGHFYWLEKFFFPSIGNNSTESTTTKKKGGEKNEVKMLLPSRANEFSRRVPL